ncbi:MAG: alpha/beta hydrolase family protein [Acidimicrobiia bacterium]
MIRSLYGAARIPDAEPPYDTVHFRVFYPAATTGSDTERLTGEMNPQSGQPLPVVIFLPGVNVPPDSYTWLASAIAESGMAAVTLGVVEDVFAGRIGLSPGMDIAKVTPATYGTGPTATSVQPVLDALAEMNSEGVLAGALDTDRVALGGHSAGGTIALQSADPRYFPGIKAVFSYGAHTMPSAVLGFDEGTVLPVSPEVPTLIMVGENDGVIAASRDRYGAGPEHDPVRRTWLEGVTRSNGDSRFVVFEGANHLAISDPDDPTTARGFLEPDPAADPSATRHAIAETVVNFLNQAFQFPTNESSDAVLANSAVLSSTTK